MASLRGFDRAPAEQQHSPRGAGGRPDDAEALPEGDVLRLLSIVFLVGIEGFALLRPSTRECSVSGVRDPLSVTGKVHTGSDGKVGGRV